METHIFNKLLHAVRKSAFTTVIKQYTHSTWSLEDVEKRRLKIREMIMPGDIVQCAPGEYELEPLIVDLIEEALLHGGKKGLTENDLQLLIIVLLELLMKVKGMINTCFIDSCFVWSNLPDITNLSNSDTNYHQLTQNYSTAIMLLLLHK